MREQHWLLVVTIPATHANIATDPGQIRQSGTTGGASGRRSLEGQKAPLPGLDRPVAGRFSSSQPIVLLPPMLIAHPVRGVVVVLQAHDVEDDGELDVAAFKAACRTLITAQEIIVPNSSYPTRAIEKNSHDYRPLGLGYANLGALLMAAGLPYDSDEGRAYAAAITALMTATPRGRHDARRPAGDPQLRSRRTYLALHAPDAHASHIRQPRCRLAITISLPLLRRCLSFLAHRPPASRSRRRNRCVSGRSGAVKMCSGAPRSTISTSSSGV